jgi:carbon monoxide dehydrogenase subunit G
MRLTNEFDVAAALGPTWQTLLDVPRVARALPGATIESEADAGAWRGAMKIKLGPVSTAYAGSARLQDVDEDEHVASYRVEGREERGQGTAAATITTRLSARDGGTTHVVVETDLQVTGRQAQLGHGIMEDVAGAILAEFAGRLERELRGEAAPEGEDAEAALDVGSALRGALLERAGLVAAGLVVGLLLGRAVWRR